MQMREVESLKSDLEEFFLSIREFRNAFRTNAPFTFTGSPNEAYTNFMHKNYQKLKNKPRQIMNLKNYLNYKSQNIQKSQIHVLN